MTTAENIAALLEEGRNNTDIARRLRCSRKAVAEARAALGPEREAPSPDVKRLRIIADRTEKGLSPDEAKVLRDGLDQVADRLRKDAATIAGQQARIRELKQKAADATRDLGATDPYRVKCPTCGAPPTERCRATRGYVPPRQPHTARLDTAARTP